MKIKQTIYLHGEYSDYTMLPDGKFGPGIKWDALNYKTASTGIFGPLAATAEVEFDVPDNFDPRPGMVEALREQIKQERAECERKINLIEQQISNLLALPAEVSNG